MGHQTIKKKKMQIPETWNTLYEFVGWYKYNNYPIRVPENAIIYPTDVSYSCCIFRQDVYQVEMYLAKPNFVSTKHSHPFEQVVIFLGGHLQGKMGLGANSGNVKNLGRPYSSDMNTELPSPDANTVGSILPVGYWHEVTAGDQGFIFLNCQKWPSKDLMNSAVVSYEGDSLGTLHDSIIKK